MLHTVHILGLLWQVTLINAAIDWARPGPPGSRLHGLPHVSDPSDEVVEFLVKCMEWNIGSRVYVNSRTPDLASLQEMAVDLLDLLKRNLPYKCGEQEVIVLIKHTASCTRSVKFSCGATLIIPAVRVQSTSTAN